jgi:exodeoxyribonuclease-3
VRQLPWRHRQRTAAACDTGAAQSIRVIGAYFPNGQEPGSDKFEYKMAWLKGTARLGQEELRSTPAWC